LDAATLAPNWLGEISDSGREEKRLRDNVTLAVLSRGRKIIRPRRYYVVSVGCAGSVAVFLYYRENNPARLLKFKEYYAAHGANTSPYSTVQFILHSFDPDGNVLWIYSFGDRKNVCLMHKYRIARAEPLLLRSRTLPCSDVL